VDADAVTVAIWSCLRGSGAPVRADPVDGERCAHNDGARCPGAVVDFIVLVR